MEDTCEKLISTFARDDGKFSTLPAGATQKWSLPGYILFCMATTVDCDIS